MGILDKERRKATEGVELGWVHLGVTRAQFKGTL